MQGRAIVARELAPAGVRSAPKPDDYSLTDESWCQVLRLLRTRTGASSLATRYFFQARLDCSSATPAPTSPEYGAVTSHTGIPLK